MSDYRVYDVVEFSRADSDTERGLAVLFSVGHIDRRLNLHQYWNAWVPAPASWCSGVVHDCSMWGGEPTLPAGKLGLWLYESRTLWPIRAVVGRYIAGRLWMTTDGQLRLFDA